VRPLAWTPPRRREAKLNGAGQRAIERTPWK
jgi:hypothetical protein